MFFSEERRILIFGRCRCTQAKQSETCSAENEDLTRAHVPPYRIIVLRWQSSAGCCLAKYKGHAPCGACPFGEELLGGKGQFIKMDGVRRYALVSVNLIINGNAVPSCICRAVGPTEVGGFSVQRDGIE